MQKNTLPQAVNILLFIVLSAAILYMGRSFLIPFILACLLAMVFIPFCRWLENKNLNRGLASLVCVVCFTAIAAGILTLLGWQLSNIGEDSSQLQQKFAEQVQKVEQYISKTLGVSPEKQEQFMKEQSNKQGTGIAKAMPFIMSSLLGFAVNVVLVLVYMFLLLYLRSHLKNFILKLQRSSAEREKTGNVLEKTGRVVQQYLTGLGAMIAMLWVLYGIGFSIVGVKYALFFAILCGLLEIVPFVGNLTGTTLTLLMVIIQGGSGLMIAGILLTYLVIQFVQTYILEPLIVGSQVNINPLFTIIVLIVGELIWGIGGMVMAIPLAGIVKIICENVENLQPYAYLLGTEKKKRNNFLKPARTKK